MEQTMVQDSQLTQEKINRKIQYLVKQIQLVTLQKDFTVQVDMVTQSIWLLLL